jgi:uncharacterized cupredoxin-like copper-binding protein
MKSIAIFFLIALFSFVALTESSRASSLRAMGIEAPTDVASLLRTLQTTVDEGEMEHDEEGEEVHVEGT